MRTKCLVAQQICWAYHCSMSTPRISKSGSAHTVSYKKAGMPKSLMSARRTGKVSGAQRRTELLIESFGGTTALAKVLGVSVSQPSRWRSGAESPGLRAGRLVIDLDHVMARATMLWTRETAIEWLEGSNSYLDGARPIDVLKTRGSSEIIEALDAAQSGAFG